MAAPTGYVTVTVNDEGYFRKSFGIKPTMSVKKLVDKYRTHLCECTKPDSVEFWYETTKLEDQTAKILELKNGDIIDVRTTSNCTRGACPIPTEQTLPNIHYKAATDITDNTGIQESQEVHPAPERISFTIKEPNGFSLRFTTKKDAPMALAMQAFAQRIQKEVKDCRFIFDGDRVNGTDTPQSLELEDEDLIDVYWEQQGGALAGLCQLF